MREIIEKFADVVYAQKLSYREMSKRSGIPASTLCGAMKIQSAGSETIRKMIRYIKKEETHSNAYSNT